LNVNSGRANKDVHLVSWGVYYQRVLEEVSRRRVSGVRFSAKGGPACGGQVAGVKEYPS
jgi:hypothetical protein